MTGAVDDDTAEEFLAASSEAVRRSGADALDALGWWELLAELEEPSARSAVFTVFRAQGRELGSTGALAALLAQPYGVAGAGAAVVRSSPRRGEILVLVGPPPESVLIDRPGLGVSLHPRASLQLQRIDVPGRLELHEIEVDGEGGQQVLTEGDAAGARARSRGLGRLAIAFEQLGAAEAVLALAVAYAGDRVQFGKPIGTFQAIRHELAWARTECAAVEAVAAQALRLDRQAPPGLDAVLKVLAGRNTRRVCERTLQVFGGVGFTAEHDHHHFHSRVLALDPLLGSSAELAAEVGARLRAEGDPGVPASFLLPGHAGAPTVGA